MSKVQDKPPQVVTGDLDLTKKKKKKKQVATDDAPAAPAPVEEPAAKEPTPTPAPAPKSEEPAPVAVDADAGGDDLLDMKKKKKKKKVTEETQAALADEPTGEPEADPEDDGQLVVEKRKKKVRIAQSDTAVATTVAGSTADPESLPWAGSDRDYTYEELLQRITDILKEKNPDLSEKKRLQMKPPQVMREGTKKTVFLNFAEICKAMKRTHEHVQQFMLAELGTSGSIDGSLRLVIKGRFQQPAIEKILRQYVVEYVTCHSCKSADTILKKDNRLFFLSCKQCGAERSVAAIKQGYVANVGKRKKV